MTRRLIAAAVAAGTVLGPAGCCHKKCCTSPPPGGPYGGPPTIPAPGVPTTPYGGSTVPSVVPSGGAVVPGPRPTDLPPPSIDLPRGANLGPPAAPAPSVQPPTPKEELLPDPLPGTTPTRSQYPAPPKSQNVLGGPVYPKAQTPEPPVARAAPPVATPSTVPVGLPGFARIKDGVAGGRKPALDGFDWLKQAGYRTVVILHGPGADLAADRELAEKKGLAVVPIEVTPETLPAALTKFNEAVADRASRPAYVYDDRDGLRVGAVAYLHFRTAEDTQPDAARIRAAGLGLSTPDQSDEAKAFWVAINDYLAKR